MAANPEVRIILNGQDNASKAVQGVRQSIEALAGTIIAQQAITQLKDQFNQAVDASNKTQNAFAGLSTIAGSLGLSTNATTNAAKSLASDGLMSVSDAATGLKNLLLTHFGLDQAVSIMERFKDTASFGRQASLGFGESIVGATEGIKNQNEILLDNAGMSTNATHLIMQQGGALTDFSNISADATTRTRFFNGMMNDTVHQLGDAAKFSATFSGQQATLGQAVFTTQAKLGDLLKVGLGPLVQGGINWIQNNQQTAVSLMGAAGVVVAFAGTLIGLTSVVRFVSLVLGGPLMVALTAISAIVGVVAFGAFNKLQDQMLKVNKTTNDNTDANKQAAAQQQAVTKEAKKMAEQLKELDENILKSNRDFQQSLTDIVKSHESKITDLKKQTADEQASFAQAQADKADSFKTAQRDMAIQHQDQTAQLQRDLDNEMLKGRFADQGRVQDLQLRLQKENDSYARSTAEKLAAYQKDTENSQAADTTKLTDLQTQLAQETSFMQQHADVLKGIRATDAKDEIDKLIQSHADQMHSFEDQRKKIKDNAAATGTDAANAYNDALKKSIDTGALKGAGAEMGKQMMNALGQAIRDSVGQLWNNLKDLAEEAVTYVKILAHYGGGGGSGPNSNSAKFDATWNDYLSTGNVKYRAAGGPVEAGQPYMTGEEGQELFIPSVNGTIIPHKQTEQLFNSSSSSKTINQTNHYHISSNIDMEAATRSQMLELRLA